MCLALLVELVMLMLVVVGTRYRSSFSLEPYRSYCVAWLAPEKKVSLNSCY